MNCPYCGTELKDTNWERKFCPNCGIIKEPEEPESDEGHKSYIG